MTVLRVGNKAYSQLYDAHAYEEINSWFSMYTKCSEESMAALDQRRRLS